MAAVLAAPSPSRADEPPNPQYSVRQDEPTTGTRVRRRTAESGTLPLNQRYEQLSLEDRRWLRSQYDGLPETDEPPFPSEGLKPIFQAIAKINQKRGARGPLLLVATVAPTGDVEKVEAIGDPDAALVRAASEVLLLTKFKPARCAGQPCTMEFPLRLDFKRG